MNQEKSVNRDNLRRLVHPKAPAVQDWSNLFQPSLGPEATDDLSHGVRLTSTVKPIVRTRSLRSLK